MQAIGFLQCFGPARDAMQVSFEACRAPFGYWLFGEPHVLSSRADFLTSRVSNNEHLRIVADLGLWLVHLTAQADV